VTGVANFCGIQMKEFSCHESMAALRIVSLILNHNHLNDLYGDVSRLLLLSLLDLSDNDLLALPPSIRSLSCLTDLRVDRNKLSAIDQGIGACTNLTALSFVDNQVRMLPTSLCSATLLTSLGYLGNGLVSPPELYLRKRGIPWILRYLRALNTISGSGTLQLMSMKLTEVPDDIVLYSISKLHLNCNDIRDVHDGVLSLSLLQSISLTNNKLMRIPPAICLLRNLQSLILDDNMVTEIPDDIGQLCSLVSLSAAHNDIFFVSPAISRLGQLRRLCLDGNQRLNNFPDSLFCLTELTALSMRECSLTQVPQAITHLVKLKDLNLSDNTLDSLPEIRALSLLSIIRLSNNRFMRLPDTILELPDLKELSLTGNLIQRLPPTFSQLTGLSILQIDAQYFGDIPREVVGRGGSNVLNYLRSVGMAESTAKLDLSGFGLRSVPAVATRFTLLQHLHLHDNPISAIPPTISNLLWLKVFTINNTKVRSLPVTLPALTALRDLLIDSTEMLFPPADVCARGIDAIFAYLRKVDMASVAGTLDLSGTEMKEFPVDIVYASGVTHVDVSNNLLTRLPPELSLMSGLTTLAVDNNPIRPSLQDVIDRGLPALMRYLGALHLATHTHKLDMTDQGLHFFPDEVSAALALSYIRLDVNLIQQLPRKIGSLVHLVDLSLCSNEITELPDTITALTRLHSLNLDANKLEVFPEQIVALSGLEVLVVSGNRLTHLHPGLGRLARLRELRAEANPLAEVPIELGALSALQTLTYDQETVEVPSRQFRADHATLMEYLHAIHLSRATHALDLSGRSLETFPVELLRLTGLTSLILARNSIAALPDDMMRWLSCLRLLDVESNQLQALPESLGFARGLTCLCALGNRITALPPSLGLVADHNLLVEVEPARLVSPPPEILTRGMRAGLGFLRFLYEARGTHVLSLNSWQLRKMPEAIVDIPGLTDLCLRHNELENLPAAVGALTSLTRLSVASNRLETLPPELGEMAALTELDYDDNPMSAGFPPGDVLERGLQHTKHFCKAVCAAKATGVLELGRLMPAALDLTGSTLTGLTRLSLDGAQAYEAAAFSLSGPEALLAPLEALSIRSAALHAAPPLVEALTMLRRLDLSDNLLERLPEPVFRALPRLRELVLTGNRLAHLPPHLGLLTALEALRVGGNALEEVPAPPTTPPHPAPSPHTVPSPPPPHLW
jgi:leucine-rich repeat protein SHOC2